MCCAFFKKGKGKGYASQSSKEHKAHHKIQSCGAKLTHKSDAYTRGSYSGNNLEQNSCKLKLGLKSANQKAAYKNKAQIAADDGNSLIYSIAFYPSTENIGIALMAHTAKCMDENNGYCCCFNTARG